MSKEKQIEEMARELNTATFGVNVHTLADHLKPETINKVAEYLYNAGYRKQEWISVEERLPDLEGGVRTWGDLRIQPSVRVLCACKQKNGKVFVKEGYCEMWGSRVVWKIPGSIDSVTHWMPLPEPPKMKGGAE
jgi:hypothetical protein